MKRNLLIMIMINMLLVQNFISLRKNSITASNRSITLQLSYYVTKTVVEFNGSYLKEDKPTFNY